MTDRIDIAFDASPDVRRAIDRFGRTEDVKFSPDNRRVALSSVEDGSIAIVDVEVTIGGDHPKVTVIGATKVTAPGLDYPHGVAFLDDDTIVVANRNASVNVFRLLAGDGKVERVQLAAADPASGFGFELLQGPNSLATTKRVDADTQVVIGHRDAGILTRHLVHEDQSGLLRVTGNEVLLRRWISVVDGVAVSRDGASLAVSNPWHQNVLVYDPASPGHEDSEPACILRGASYPHGVCFSADGRHLFVADAASPRVHVHAREGDSWRGVQYPATSVRVMDDDEFRSGRRSSSDGGPKGVDVDRSGRVLAVTCRSRPLAFFDVVALLHGIERSCAPPDRQLGYELDLVRATDAHLEARLAGITGSTSFRVAEQLRRLASMRRRFPPVSRR
jgi:hypothetical protein